MPPLARSVVAELVGTMLFVFIGAGSVVMNSATGGSLGPIGIALAHGVGLAVMVSATLGISGGLLNPAVTFAMWVAGKGSAATGGAYLIAQLVGAILAAYLIKALLPDSAVQITSAGTPQLGVAVTFMQGVWIEVVLTFLLVTAVFGTTVLPDAHKIGGFGVGLAVFVDALVGGNLTGAVMNPARAFGPAIIAGDMHGQAVYWIGPLIGAGLAALLWRGILLPKPS